MARGSCRKTLDRILHSGGSLEPDQVAFRTSAEEIERRREAYARLTAFMALGATLASVDLLIGEPLATALALSSLVAILLLSRVLFAHSFDQYARVVWRLDNESLLREVDDVSETYALATVASMRVKRTSDARVRAISLRFTTGRSLYVNALEAPEEFIAGIRNRVDAREEAEIREPLDYDAPWFYRLLGVLIGVCIGMAGRLVGHIGSVDMRFMYASVGLYCLAFGVYWLHSKPVSASYGDRKRSVDVAVGIGALFVGAVLGLVALLVP